MSEITVCFKFTVNPTSHEILRNQHSTQIRVVEIDNTLIQKINSCQNDQDILNLIKSHPSSFQIPPIGVIGPKEATPDEYQFAEKLGESLAQLGITVICGGRNGVMEAVCKGVYMQDGTSIGLIPSDHWKDANKYVKQIITTNMGPTRNSLIALSAFSLIAVGGGLGTLSEIAYGLHYDKPVIVTDTAPYVDGVIVLNHISEIISHILAILLNIQE